MPKLENTAEEENLRALQNDPHHKQGWYLQPDIAESYESFYEGKYKNADILEKRVLQLMLSKFEGTKTILDVGCGTGHFTRWYDSLGYHVVGADVSPVMLAVARKLWNGEFYNAPAQKLPFADRSYDIVSMITCTEYMPDLDVVLREARRVARYGIIMGLMNKWSLPTIRRIVQVRLGKNPYYNNATFRSLGEVKRIAREVFRQEEYEVHHAYTLYPRIIPLKVSRFPFGAFLGIAIKFAE